MNSKKKPRGGCRVTVSRHGNLVFRVNWEGIRTWEGTQFKDTPENRRLMEAQATVIRHEMKAGTFDYARYFPEGNRARKEPVEPPSPALVPTIRDYHDRWK